MKYFETPGTCYQLLLVVFVCLSLFYPTLFAEFCRVDDIQMVNRLGSINQFSFVDRFFPSGTNGLYYRPILISSFIVDHFVFNLNSFAMHLHNVVLHALNSLLLFFITRTVLKLLAHDYPLVPLIVSLVFLSHPITTESVNWISGRSDLLAGTFLLGSTWSILCYAQNRMRRFFYLGLCLFILATLTKEFAVAFLPGFIWLAMYNHKFRSGSVKWLSIVFLGLLGIVFFFVFRKLAYTSNSPMINTTLLVFLNTPERSFQIILTAIGFYTKKLFIPMPLSFAIYEVNAMYEIMAWPVVAAFLYIAWRRTLLSILFITGIILFSPAMVIALNQIAWTPYAERYLYIPAAFVTLATICYLRCHLVFPNTASRSTAVVLILVTWSGVTFNRNLTWRTNYSLVQDTLRKEPDSVDMQYILAAILIEDFRDYKQARQHLAMIKPQTGMFYDERADLFESEILRREGNIDNAIAMMEQIFIKSNNSSVKALKGLIELSEDKEIKSLHYRKVDRQKRYEARKKLLHLTHDVSMLYELGVDAKALGYEDKAKTYFTLATQNLKVNDKKHDKAIKELSSLNYQK